MSDYRGPDPRPGASDYRATDDRRDYAASPKRGGFGRTLLILLAIAAIIAAVLFATGFWRMDASGDLKAPDVDVSVKGGEVPDVDVDSKAVVVGTKEETIEVPKIETEKETIDVPVVGVSEGERDKDGADKN